jgi:hypothetical protein
MNQARLLSEKPAQSYDEYALTVYTTWQISFEKLSPCAAKIIQLCSLLHQCRSKLAFSRSFSCSFSSPFRHFCAKNAKMKQKGEQKGVQKGQL